ncbi:MAG: Ig-like domain-containing protein, partial [Promethearchaeota archaeon]
MKLKSNKKFKMTHFILFIGIILTIILLFNNTNFSNQIINNDQEYTITPKTSASTVTINSPEAMLYGASPLLINATVISGNGILDVKANINATISFNITMSNGGSGDYYTCFWSNITNCESGDYNITIIAIDDEPSENRSQSVVITIDKDGPGVSIDEPADLSSHNNDAGIEINATITDPGSGVAGAKAMINSTLGDFNLTMQEIAGTWTVTWLNTSLYVEGDYNITIWANDNRENVNQTESIVITLNDVLNPSVIIDEPADLSSHDNNAGIEINATITDP